MSVRLLIFPPNGDPPLAADLENANAIADAFVLDLRPTDPEAILRGGGSDGSFQIPLTPANRRFFEDWQNMAADAGTATLYREARLELTGFPARIGRVALMETRGDTVEIAALFDTADAFSALRDLLVSDLEWDDLATDIATMAASSDFFAGTKNVCAFPAKLRSWAVNGLGDEVVTNADFCFGISVYSILQQAFLRIRPTAPLSLDAITQFVESDYLTNLVIFLNPHRPYDGEYLRRRFGVYAGQETFTAPFVQITAPLVFLPLLEADTDNVPPFYDNGNNYDTATAEFTAPFYGEWDFVVFFNISSAAVSTLGTNVASRLTTNGVAPGPTDPGFAQVYPDGGVMTTGGAYSFAFFWRMTLNAGDVVEVQRAFVNLDAATVNATFQSTSVTVSLFNSSFLAGTSPVITGALIPPSLKVADVLKDVFQMFNLRMFWDTFDQSMRIAPVRRWANAWDETTQNGFIDNPEEDWTAYLVTPPLEIRAERYAWDYTLRHSDPVDGWLILESDSANPPQAAARLITGRAGAQPQVTEISGAAMAHIFDGTISNPAQPRVMLPMLLNESHLNNPTGQQEFATDDSIFYLFVQQVQLAAEYGQIRCFNIPDSFTSFRNCARAWQIPYDYNSGLGCARRASLGFGTESSINGDQLPGLMPVFHASTLKTANDGKLVKCRMKLDPVTLQTFKFDRPIRVMGRLFEVLFIAGQPADGWVYEVTMRTIDYPTVEDVAQITAPTTPSYLLYE